MKLLQRHEIMLALAAAILSGVSIYVNKFGVRLTAHQDCE